LIPVFEQVLGPPEEQLEKETRQLLNHTVVALYNSKPELFKGHEQVLKYAGAA
jgi:hypothetical protein